MYHPTKHDKRPMREQSPIRRSCCIANIERPRSQSDSSSVGHSRQNLKINNGSTLKISRQRNFSLDENETHVEKYKNSHNHHNCPQPTIVIDSPVESYKSFDWREKNGRIGVPFLKTCSVSTGYHSGGSEISMDHKLGEAEDQVWQTEHASLARKNNLVAVCWRLYLNNLNNTYSKRTPGY